MSQISLKQIVAPALNQPNYGANIDQQFKNIDENFKILAQYDFIKGQTGDCVALNSYPLVTANPDPQQSDDPYITPMGLEVLNVIFQRFIDNSKTIYTADPQNILTPGLTYLRSKVQAIFDKFTSSTTFGGHGCLELMNVVDHYMIAETYDPNETTITYEKKCALNGYVFKDARFNNKDMSKLQPSLVDYSNYIDMSCVVYITSIINTSSNTTYNYEILQETPSLYYDPNKKNFCWLIGGQESGLVAQGPSGFDGKNAQFHLFKCDSSSTVTGLEVIVTKYMRPATGITSWSDIDSGNISEFNIGDACMLFSENASSATGYDVYFSKITNILASSSLYACQVIKVNDCLVNSVINATQLDQILTTNCGIGQNIRGLHVPYKVGDSEHLIWSTGSNGINSALHITPCSRITPTSSAGTPSPITGSINLDYSQTTVMSHLIVGDKVDVKNGAYVTRGAYISGGAYVTGGANVTGNARVTGGAYVTGNAYVTGGANISGISRFYNDIIVSTSVSTDCAVRTNNLSGITTSNYVRIFGHRDAGSSVEKNWSDLTWQSSGTPRRDLYCWDTWGGRKNDMTITVGTNAPMGDTKSWKTTTATRSETDNIANPIYISFRGYPVGTLAHIRIKFASSQSTAASAVMSNAIYFHEAVTKDPIDKWLNVDPTQLEKVSSTYYKGWVVVDALIYVTKNSSDDGFEYMLIKSAISYEDFSGRPVTATQQY